MFHLLSNLICTALVSATTLTANPNSPKAPTSFGASAFVTINNEIRVAVDKPTREAMVVLLRNEKNEVLFEQRIGKKEKKYAAKFNVSDLKDGQYEIEFKSGEGSIRKQLNVTTPVLQQHARTIIMD